jgi:large subunit ribosomal protein L18
MIQKIYRYRLFVYRTNKRIYAQITDETKGITLVGASDMGVQEKDRMKRAFLVGEQIAKKALKKKITHVWFDRKNYRYHGRVKTLADGARKGGLVF